MPLLLDVTLLKTVLIAKRVTDRTVYQETNVIEMKTKTMTKENRAQKNLQHKDITSSAQ